MPRTDGAEVLADRPEVGLLMVAVPMAIPAVRALDDGARQALAKEAGDYIAHHGDDLLFRSKKAGRSAKAFEMLATGLAIGALQPGGVDFAGMHFCADHEACLAAAEAAAPSAGAGAAGPT